MTWFRLLASTTVLDFPLHAPPGSEPWVATMWPDGRYPHGWARRPWQPGPDGRGFIPSAVELGDVLQFGVRHAPRPGLPTGQAADQALGRPQGGPAQSGIDPAAGAVSTWYGYLHAVRADAIVVHGPFASPPVAYAAAQQALLQHMHQPPEPAHRGHPSSQLGTGLGMPGAGVRPLPVTPAQPPASVTVSFDGAQATVGDPVHGWLVVETDRLTAALGHTPAQLAAHLHDAAPQAAAHLTGHDAPLTLAALAAQYLPYQLPPPTYPVPTTSSGPPAPAAAPTAGPPPAAAAPPTPAGATTPPGTPSPTGPPSAADPSSAPPNRPGLPPDPPTPTPGADLS